MTVEVVSVAGSEGWWHLGQVEEGGPWRRRPVACWGLVRDTPESMSYVVAMVSVGDGLELAQPGGFLRHDVEARRCGCTLPASEVVDPGFCTVCAGVGADRG